MVMPFSAELSLTPNTQTALAEVCQRIREQFSSSPDLAVLFFSAHHARKMDEAAVARIRKELSPRCLLGCQGEAIIGNDQEVEGNPAICLWTARWVRPVEIVPFHLTLEQTPDGYSLLGWPDRMAEAEENRSTILLLGEPTTFPVDAFLQQMNENYPGLRVLGGMASGAGRHSARLLLNDQIVERGAAGVLLSGVEGIRCIVSQGCRPIGRHMVITRAHDNVIEELSGRTPLAQLQQLWQELGPRDQELFRQGLHIGRVINEYQGEFQRGDFLVRNVLGLESDTGALALNDLVRVGQTVQFHVRDAQSADEDLHALLQMDVCAHERKPSGALAFSCNGRGTRLFPAPNHDAQVIRKEAGAVPLAGFFAQGELGPVGGMNFIHGFTASVALFEE
jgi:small ligand-binding sensory domain FIST